MVTTFAVAAVCDRVFSALIERRYKFRRPVQLN